MSAVAIALLATAMFLTFVNFFYHSAILALVLFILFVGVVVAVNRPGDGIGANWLQDAAAVLSMWSIISILVYLLPGKSRRRV